MSRDSPQNKTYHDRLEFSFRRVLRREECCPYIEEQAIFRPAARLETLGPKARGRNSRSISNIRNRVSEPSWFGSVTDAQEAEADPVPKAGYMSAQFGVSLGTRETHPVRDTSSVWTVTCHFSVESWPVAFEIGADCVQRTGRTSPGLLQKISPFVLMALVAMLFGAIQ